MSLTIAEVTINETAKSDSRIKCEMLLRFAKLLATDVLTIEDEHERKLAIEIVKHAFMHDNDTWNSAECQKLFAAPYGTKRAGQISFFNYLIGQANA